MINRGLVVTSCRLPVHAWQWHLVATGTRIATGGGACPRPASRQPVHAPRISGEHHVGLLVRCTQPLAARLDKLQGLLVGVSHGGVDEPVALVDDAIITESLDRVVKERARVGYLPLFDRTEFRAHVGSLRQLCDRRGPRREVLPTTVVPEMVQDE